METAIHYHGCLDDVSELDAALRMIRKECDERGWICHAIDFPLRGRHLLIRDGYAYEVEVDLHWRGWSIDAHEKCDSLVLAFDNDGWLLLSYDAPNGAPLISYELSVVTQHALPRVHAEICTLLRRLQNQFATQGLVVDDSTGYFDTQDKVQLFSHWGREVVRANAAAADVLVDMSELWFSEDAVSVQCN